MLVKSIKIFQKQQNKKQKYDCDRYRNLPEDEYQKLVEYRKNYQLILMRKLIETS